MAFPIIGYKSIAELAGATLTDPGTAAGFSIGNLIDHRAFTIWKSDGVTSPINIDIDAGAAVSADYVTIVNHNLNTNGATVTVLSDDDSGYGSTTTQQAAFSPGEDTVTFKGFTSQATERYWRIVITDPSPPFAAAPYIGVLKLGLRTTLPDMLNPGVDPFIKQVEVRGERSEGGNYLGAILGGQRHRADLAFGGEAGVARTFLSSDFNAFLDDHAYKRLPFVFVLDTADSDFNVARWVKVPDRSDLKRSPVGGVWSRMTVTLPVEEALSESP